MGKIFAFIRRLFKGLKNLAKQFVTPSIATVENIKRFVESPAVPFITALIPGNLDDRIAQKLRDSLPKVLQVLRISEECLKLEAADEIIKCAIEALRKYQPEGRNAMYHAIAAKLAEYASDRRITWSEAVHLAEMPFTMKEQQKGNA